LKYGWIAGALLAAFAITLITAVTSVQGVAQTPVKPALVRDIDNGDKLPLYGNASLDLEVVVGEGRAGESPCVVSAPAGKRLVIEHVSAQAFMPAGQTARFAITDTRNFNQYLVSYYQGTNVGGTKDIYVASQAIRQRVVPGERVCLEISRNATTGTATVHWGVSGYFVDYP
jgi:hypothetical protein